MAVAVPVAVSVNVGDGTGVTPSPAAAGDGSLPPVLASWVLVPLQNASFPLSLRSER
jgi:hypothetical protein